MMGLEATRTTCRAAMLACQAALQSVEAMMLAHDQTDPAPNENPWGTFDDAATPPPPTGGRSNGRSKAK